MLTVIEKIVVGLVVLTAVEVVVFCTYGTGSDYTAREKEVMGDQIVLTTGTDLADLRSDPEWEIFFQNRLKDGARAARRKASDEPGEPGKDGDGEEGERGEDGDRGEGRREREQDGSSYMEKNWLADSSAQWELRRIPMAVRDAELSDLNRAIGALQGAAAEPITMDDGTQAFQVTSVQPGSLIEKGGFQPGDVLVSVNGNRVEGPQDGMRLYGELKNETRFVVEILRDGQLTTLFYTLD